MYNITTKSRITAIRLLKKLELNSQYAEKLGISYEIKKTDPKISNSKKGGIEWRLEKQEAIVQ